MACVERRVVPKPGIRPVLERATSLDPSETALILRTSGGSTLTMSQSGSLNRAPVGRQKQSRGRQTNHMKSEAYITIKHNCLWHGTVLPAPRRLPRASMPPVTSRLNLSRRLSSARVGFSSACVVPHIPFASSAKEFPRPFFSDFPLSPLSASLRLSRPRRQHARCSTRVGKIILETVPVYGNSWRGSTQGCLD